MSVSPKQYRYVLATLRLTQAAAGDLLGVGARTSRRCAQQGISGYRGPAEILLRLLLMESISERDISNAILNRAVFGPR
jgi:hypothetical protein